MFETNLKDERFLPFEGAGAISTWTLSLPTSLRTFDYMTISDVILHIRYTARQAGDPLGSQATEELQTMLGKKTSQALVFCLRYDFPTEWSAFVTGTKDFVATFGKDYFPYFVQSKQVMIDELTLYAASADDQIISQTVDPNSAVSGDLNSGAGTVTLTLPVDSVLKREASRQVFLLLQYHLEMQVSPIRRPASSFDTR